MNEHEILEHEWTKMSEEEKLAAEWASVPTYKILNEDEINSLLGFDVDIVNSTKIKKVEIVSGYANINENLIKPGNIISIQSKIVYVDILIDGKLYAKGQIVNAENDSFEILINSLV